MLVTIFLNVTLFSSIPCTYQLFTEELKASKTPEEFISSNIQDPEKTGQN